MQIDLVVWSLMLISVYMLKFFKWNFLMNFVMCLSTCVLFWVISSNLLDNHTHTHTHNQPTHATVVC